MPKYRVKADEMWIEGRLKTKGEPVELSEAAAKYYLIAESIAPWVEPTGMVEVSSEPEAVPTRAKRAQRGGTQAEADSAS